VHAGAVPVGAARARGVHAGGHRRPADAARVHAASVVDEHARAHIGVGADRFHDIDQHVDDKHDRARVVDHDDETVSRPARSAR